MESIGSFVSLLLLIIPIFPSLVLIALLMPITYIILGSLGVLGVIIYAIFRRHIKSSLFFAFKLSLVYAAIALVAGFGMAFYFCKTGPPDGFCFFAGIPGFGIGTILLIIAVILKVFSLKNRGLEKSIASENKRDNK